MKPQFSWRGMMTAVVFAVNILTPSGPRAQDQTHHALIIANMAYADNVGRLHNPHKDAELIRRALFAVGFSEANIEIVHDATRGETLAAVERYATRLAGSGNDATGFFYYSGHGAAKPNTNQNYIIPVNVADASASTLWHEAVALDNIRDLLQENAPQAAHIVVFDACRNELQSGQKGAKGFVPVQEWGGMLIAYSTAPGRTASDGDRTASAGPYATALAEQLNSARGVSASDLFARVRFAVRARADGQSPWFLHGLDREISFGKALSAAEVSKSPPQTPLSDAAEAWQVVEHTQSEAILESFIDRFRDSVYGGFARSRL
jgi:uncharacterized caspase-like protein